MPRAATITARSIPAWEFYPTYLAKLTAVRRYLDALPTTTRVLDAGCGEGVIVEEYAGRLDITGVDANYSSGRVLQGSLTSLPFPDGSFDRALCLDVLEHLVVRGPAAGAGRSSSASCVPAASCFVSVPNLAHLQSRIQFLLRGRLIRTASELQASRRSADRGISPPRPAAPASRSSGRQGIFPTIPVLTHYIRRHPRALLPVHRALTLLLPVPGWCLLNLLTFRKA